jgi:hypothetical protein
MLGGGCPKLLARQHLIGRFSGFKEQVRGYVRDARAGV